MTKEQAKSELMQIYMSLSEEKKQALDVLMAQADGEYDDAKYHEEHGEVVVDKAVWEDAKKSLEPCGDAISREELLKAIDTWDRFGVDDTNSLFRLDNLSLPHYVAYIHYDDVVKCIKGMPSVAIPPDHDGCKDCKYETYPNYDYPCCECKQNYKDMWEMEKPTDTITMTREEFSEKLMEHYRQGRADEKAYQNGEIMQSFNPD